MTVISQRYSKENVLRKLYEATSGGEMSFEERVSALFSLGHMVLGLRIGILAHIRGDDYDIAGVSCPSNMDMTIGMRFELRDTYCCKVLEAKEPIGFASAEGSPWADHPCYEKFGLESYLGAPVIVNGEVYGTLNFSDSESRSTEFTGFEGELIRLMARWVGGELERQWTGRAFERNNRMLQMVADSQSEFIRSGDAHAIFDRMLTRVLEFTESDYGFIGEIHEDEEGTPYLQTHAITNIAWNEETRKFYDESGPSGMIFRNLKSLFGHVIATSEIVIANKPAEDPRRCGIPVGHPALNCFLGLPIFSGGVMTGMMGIANRPAGYDEEICTALEPFLATCGNMISSFQVEASRKQSEEALRESEAKARAVLDTAAEGVITIDEVGRIESFNPAAERIFGYTAAEVSGENVKLVISPEHAESHDRYIENYLRTGVAKLIGFTREVEGRHKSGSVIPIELSLSEVLLGDRRLFTGLVRDITSRKQAEEELKDFANKLERSNQELREFTYVASHDLQEPMRKLVAFSGMLERDLGADVDDAVQKDLGFIVDAAGRLQNLVEDLLALSRTGSMSMPARDVSLEACAKMALDALSLRVEETGAEITMPELPEVRGDRLLLTQLFQNLISNSLKFIEGKTPRIQVTCQTDDGRTIFGVQDNGIGMKPEHSEQIFAPFKRLHGRTEFPGTGIGLAICRKAVERHGGELWVESEIGVGSHFRFTLRLREDEENLR